jgi:hypothetical protein
VWGKLKMHKQKFSQKSNYKKPLLKPKCRRGDDIKMVRSLVWINMAQYGAVIVVDLVSLRVP